MNTAQSLPVSTPSDNEILADKISRLAAHIHAATYRFLMLVLEFDERDAWVETGSTSCAHWLSWRCGINLHTAREKVRVAHALKGLEKISAAFERGELSYSKVRAITRIANTDNEDTLLNIALSGTASQLERVVRCEIRCEREADVVERTEAAFEHRAFGWHTASDGSVEFFGRLPAELAEHVIKAIEAMEANLKASLEASQAACLEEANRTASLDSNDEAPHQVTHEAHNEINFTGTLRADDSERFKDDIELDNKGRCGDDFKLNSKGRCEDDSETSIQSVPAGTFADSDDRPVAAAARRADALVALCNSHCDGYEVTLHVPVETSLHANSLEKTGTIPMEAAKRICCDAAIIPVTEDDNGEVLDIGRRTRKIPPSIRRALEIRDKGCCRFPGCTSQRFLKGHHIKHWAHGGKTCLDNLVLLCWQHHHLVHEGGFLCKAIHRKHCTGINIVFGTPNGVIIPDAFAPKPTEHKLEDGQSHLNIHAHTCVARDVGTRLDVNTVIDALAFRKRRDRKP